jgi:hypothetical protein
MDYIGTDGTWFLLQKCQCERQHFLGIKEQLTTTKALHISLSTSYFSYTSFIYSFLHEYVVRVYCVLDTGLRNDNTKMKGDVPYFWGVYFFRGPNM